VALRPRAPTGFAADEGLGARNLMRDKRAIIGLQLPARMLFLFRLRFGLYAVRAAASARGCVMIHGLT